MQDHYFETAYPDPFISALADTDVDCCCIGLTIDSDAESPSLAASVPFPETYICHAYIKRHSSG
ncbi:MAG: hypothetical protein HC853_04660 [Anaerolineae bacterium]|nr:hypothetical protein [Anaerolineae bacterium]